MDTTDHDSAALRKIAQQLGLMLKEIGGAQHIKTLLGALRLICEDEDSNIRQGAVESIVNLGKALPANEFVAHIPAFVNDICADGWYPLRCAGTCVLCMLYSSLPSTETSVFNPLLRNLANDQVVMVRRSLAQSLRELLKGCTSFPPAVLEILTILAKDESCAITIEIPPCLAIISASHPDIALNLAEIIWDSPDKLWQAKSVLICYIDQIFAKNPPKEFIKKIASSFSGPLSCVAVRAAIARHLKFLYSCGCFDGPQDFDHFVHLLINDSDSDVRIAVATVLGSMPHELSELTTQALGKLLEDFELDVKMAALKSIAEYGLGIENAIVHLPTLVKTAKWRLKKGIAILFPRIAEPLTVEQFDTLVTPIIEGFLADEADEVRLATIGAFPGLVKKFGNEWRDRVIVPMIRNEFSSPDYMMRKSAITAILKLEMTQEFRDVIEKAAKDPVSNVRLVLARDVSRGSDILSTLQKDADSDVAYYASKR
jgi:serine/threonine-protein phosphatase 2A regulatory subunit A